MSPVGEDLLVLHVETHDPVEWHLRAAMERKDIPKLLLRISKPSIILHLLRAFFYAKKNPKELEDIMDKSISL